MAQAPEREVKTVLARYTLAPNAAEVCEQLRRDGYDLTILSAGIDLLVAPVARKLGIERWMANGIETDGCGRLTGEGVFRVDLRRKDEALRTLIQPLGVSLAEVAAVGDSKYDIPVMEACGVGIVFQHPTESRVAWPGQFKRITSLDQLPEVLRCFTVN